MFESAVVYTNVRFASLIDNLEGKVPTFLVSVRVVVITRTTHHERKRNAEKA